MKKIINRLFLAMMLSMSLLAACTTEEDAPAPNFPEKVSRIVNIDEEGGNIVTLSISPNQDWVVSIPSSASDYWAILDNEQQVLSTGGPAGNYDVRIICLAAEADLDSHTVDVSMRMGGETRVIATITLAEGEAVFNVYQANIVTDDESGYRHFEAAGETDDFNYVYPAAPLAEGTGVEMLWNQARNGYVSYIKVEANFNWTPDDLGGLVLTSIENNNSNARYRELEIFCSAVNYPAEGNVSYTMKLTSSENPNLSIPVSVPPFEPVLEVGVTVPNDDRSDFMTPDNEDDEYNWVFEDYAASVDMLWRPSVSATEVDAYILVRTNFGFTIADDDKPEWLAIDEPRVIEETSNDYVTETVYHVSVSSENINLQGDAGDFSIMLGDIELGSYNVNYGSMEHKFYVSNVQTFEFDGNGRYSPSTTIGSGSTDAELEIFSTDAVEDLEVHAFSVTNGVYEEMTDDSWIGTAVSLDDNSVGKINTYVATVTTQPNAGAYRQGVVVILPSSVSEGLPSGDLGDVLFENNEIKAEYAGYLVANVRQSEQSADTGIISPIDPDLWKYEMSRFDVLAEDPSGNGLEYAYKITYAAAAAQDEVLNSGRGSVFEVDGRISFRAETTDGTEWVLDETSWLKVEEDENGNYYITMEPYGIEDTELYVFVLDRDGNELAVIDCVYDTQAQITDENIEFYRTQPEGFTLSKLQNGSSEIPSGMGAAAYWLLEYSGTADASVALQGLPQEISSFMVNPWGITWLDVIYTSGLCQIDFNLSEWTEGSTECYINFHNSDNMLPVCIICRATGLGSQTEGDGSAE